MKQAFLYPGQGAQHVGMGKDLHEAFPAARRVFEEAQAATGLPIKKLCFEGPEDELSRTDCAQPCIFTVSAAALAVLEDLLGPEKYNQLRPQYMAGLSLGEYTALHAAGALGFADMVRLVARRGELMQKAAEDRPSSMVAVIGLDEAQANELCEKASRGQILTPANFNCPGQIVLSGETEACRRAADLAAEMGARGATMLQVAGAFHSEIMAPAAEQFAKDLADADFREPSVTVISNVDAAPHGSPESIRRKLTAQLTGSVRWQQSMERLLAEGVEAFCEIGPGKVLAGLMRRIDRKATVTVVNSREALEALAGTGGQ